jgi:hypothetical protein
MRPPYRRKEEWRLVATLKSRQALKDYVEFHNLSVRTLAAKAKKADGKPLGHAIVGHLIRGTRSTCNLQTARAIEEALGCPPGFLFEASMSRVADSPRRSVAA